VKVPGSDFTEETMASLLALTDVMSTGYHAAISAGVGKGQTVAVVGDGAVGLCGVLSATMLGAERIILLASTQEDRHRLAREWGATDVITARGQDAVAAVHALTDGYGAHAVLECVGTEEATGPPSPWPGSINPGRVFDLTTDLDNIAEAYAAMDERRAIKALITISER
jgi:alcohol dehydrogenase